VPLYDTLSVLAIRLHTGKPLLAGDRNHFSHRLLRLGMSPRRVLVTIGLVALATSLGATLPYGSATWRVVVPVVQAAAIVCVIMQLELASAESGPPKTNDGG
jgi:UDP-GlcNAc:undecaprenyl-phosphate GlcNAc-1-phosphate transferase